MAFPEVTGRKVSLERAAYTISDFCDAHRISRAQYYNLKKLGQCLTRLAQATVQFSLPSKRLPAGDVSERGPPALGVVTG